MVNPAWAAFYVGHVGFNRRFRNELVDLPTNVAIRVGRFNKRVIYLNRWFITHMYIF